MFHHLIWKAELLTFSIHFLFWRINTFSGSNCLGFGVFGLGFFNNIIVSSHLQGFTTKKKFNEEVPTGTSAFLPPHFPLWWLHLQNRSNPSPLASDGSHKSLKGDHCLFRERLLLPSPRAGFRLCFVTIIWRDQYNGEIPHKPHSRKATGTQFIKITDPGSVASSQDLHKTHWAFHTSWSEPLRKD